MLFSVEAQSNLTKTVFEKFKCEKYGNMTKDMTFCYDFTKPSLAPSGIVGSCLLKCFGLFSGVGKQRWFGSRNPSSQQLRNWRDLVQ